MSFSYPAVASVKRSERWDNLLEFSHKFTWYPTNDIQELLQTKAAEYQQTLDEYQKILISELTDGAAVGQKIDSGLFATPKPWKLYYRLAIAEFCSYLVNNDSIYLENAITALSVIQAKKEMANVSYWHYILQSYRHLAKKDRDAFVHSVSQLWNDAIRQSEINQMIIKSNTYQAGLNSDLDFFYENTAHLIITKAIIEGKLPDLSSLSGIVISLNDKLTLDYGYQRFVEAIVGRLEGLKSDNNNLNFAVAYVEATAHQHELEDEVSPALIVEKYNATRLLYELSLSWASTRKGKTAILTQYMGFNNYIIRRLAESDPRFTPNAVFLKVPDDASQLVDTSTELYDVMAKSANQPQRSVRDGFLERSHYIEAMHQLWDSIAKLLITLASYHTADQPVQKVGTTNVAEVYLLKYLSLFQKYTQADLEIVPDNAFYMAAYAAGQMSALCAIEKQYSTSMRYNNLAFAYQLQAVELFPLDMPGIMKLAHQTDQENRPRIYFKYVTPIASRLKDSAAARSWLDQNLIGYKNPVAITLNVVPDIVENAFLYLNILQQSDRALTEEDLYSKLLIMHALSGTLKSQNLERQLPHSLSEVAQRNIPDDGRSLKALFEESLPPGARGKGQTPSELQSNFSIHQLRSELYASPELKIHGFLRALFFENTDRSYQNLL
jgi:hypothetical protein